jgi:hypothetical protein
MLLDLKALGLVEEWAVVEVVVVIDFVQHEESDGGAKRLPGLLVLSMRQFKV